MYKEPIFLLPTFKERIWGGKKLKQEFNYDIPYEKTGEAWVISAHENGPNVVQNGPLAGKTLIELWEEHGELFNKDANDVGEFPLLVKILDANTNLSVQVHPDDKFAREVENVPYGKTECWYVLDAEEDASIVLGHYAENKEELEAMMDQGKWGELLQYRKVNPGEFYYVPSGTIHAIGKGIMILEIQQSSDITYRVYDYDRKDDQGNKRELHLERAKEVTNVPHQSTDFNQNKKVIQDLKIETLVEEQYFSVYHWELNGKVTRELTDKFLLVSVIKGTATLKIDKQTFTIEKGNNFILPHGVQTFDLYGHAELVVSHS